MRNSLKFKVKSSRRNNISQLLKEKLPRNVFNLVRKIGKLADDQGVAAYLVGGFVRDVLLGVENLDLDIVIEGDATYLAELLEKRMKIDVVIHQKFGTATLIFPNSFKLDLASARKEVYPYPASLPSVTFSSIRDDLFRRDFTINTLASKINQDSFGQLLDLFNGQEDLKERKIRVLHDKSFLDDPTRILRAIRFEQRCNFKIEPKTSLLMRRAIASGMLQRLTHFRFGREFILLLKEPKPLKAISRFDRLCGVKLVHPLIKLDKMVCSRLESPRAKDDWLVYFTLLTQGLNEQQWEKLCCDFSLTKKDKQRLKTLRKKDCLQ